MGLMRRSASRFSMKLKTVSVKREEKASVKLSSKTRRAAGSSG